MQTHESYNRNNIRMEGIRWFKSYNELMQCYPIELRADFNTLEAHERPIYIARELNYTGAKEFGFCYNVEFLKTYKATHKSDAIHELINFEFENHSLNNKLYFDVDAKIPFELLEPQDADNVRYLLNSYIKSSIITLINIYSNTAINKDILDIIVCPTIHKNKYSAHFIAYKIYVDRYQNITIAKTLNEKIKEDRRTLICKIAELITTTDSVRTTDKIRVRTTDKISEFIEHLKNEVDFSSLIDMQAYKQRTQSLRIAGCAKLKNPDKIKTILQPYYIHAGYSLEDTLITLIEPEPVEFAEQKYLWPHQRKEYIDNARREWHYLEFKTEYVSQKLTDVSQSLTTFNDSQKLTTDSITMILDNLNPARADNRQDWRNIGFICGNIGEQARAPFHKWAAQSKKYSKLECDKIFNQGNGKLSIGTLLYMLKEDVDDADTSADTYQNITRLIYQTIAYASADDEAEQDKIPSSLLDKLDKYLLPDTQSNIKKFNDKKIERTIRRLTRMYGNMRVSNINTTGRYVELTDEQYAEIFMNIRTTIAMRVNMGGGKTELVKQIIKKVEADKNKKQRVMFISFRRSLASDINNRFKEIGFVDYRDIEGDITDEYEKVILQLESLHRWKWTAAPDICIIDESESLLTQIEAETVKRKRDTWLKLNAAIRESKHLIYMDANLSELSMTHISKLRQDMPQYLITNSATDASKYPRVTTQRQFISVEYNKWHTKLIGDIKQNKNVVIGSNYGPRRMESIKCKIQKDTGLKNEDILLITSKTINDPLVQKAVENVNDLEHGFVKYKLVIYTPTIQAGISFTHQHFHKFYGMFNNQSCSVYATTQMMKRVRHLYDNEYNCCIEHFGAARWSSNKIEFEKSLKYRMIDLNTDITKNELLKRDFTFAEGYTYDKQDPYYDLYVNIMTTRARDQNSFLYEFMKTMLDSGEFDAFEKLTLDEDNETDEGAKREVNEITRQLKDEQLKAIVEAPVIDDERAEQLSKLLQASNDHINDTDFNALLRYRSCTNYNMHPQMLNFETLKTLNGKFNKFKNIKDLYQFEDLSYGLKKLQQKQQDAKQAFNGEGKTDAMTDIRFSQNIVNKHISTSRLIKLIGFDDLLDEQELTKTQIWSRISKNVDYTDKLIKITCEQFEKRQCRRPDIKKLLQDELKGFKNFMGFSNSILEQMYDAKIKETKNHSNKYKIQKCTAFRYKDTEPEVVEQNGSSIFKPLVIPSYRMKEWKEVVSLVSGCKQAITKITDPFMSDDDDDDGLPVDITKKKNGCCAEIINPTHN
jgi:hypothetical protein